MMKLHAIKISGRWIGVCASLLSGCVLPEDLVILDNRVTSLEQRNTDLEKRTLEAEKKQSEVMYMLQGYNQNQDAKEFNLRNQTAEVNVSLNKLREDLRALSGKVEELDYGLQKKTAGLDEAEARRETLLQRIQESSAESRGRLQRVEAYLQLENAKGQTPAPRPPESGALPAAKTLSEGELYESARQAFDRGDLEGARQGFQQVLSRFPNSSNADNAQFWIGESYYREKWFEKAILEYQKVMEKYPQGNKVPAALLKQGMSFLSLDDKTNARLVLRELVKKHPQSNEAKIASQKLKEF
ncbi:MAG: tol-pal system protein YbgF [Desulfobacterales bacterium]|nr:tol-pal system protein YbgF [Desulfobacterales bacterium]